MAVITPTVVPIASGAGVLVTWTAVLAADTCAPVELLAYPKRSVQFAGTFDSATLLLTGSIDGSAYRTLTDKLGTDLSATASEIEPVEELTRYIKPTTSGGGGSSSANILILAMK